MFLHKNAVKVLGLSLLLAQVSFLNAMPDEQDQTNLSSSANESMTLQQTAGTIPPPPPGPYFSSAVPTQVVSTKETPISTPVQMPASVPVDGQIEKSAEKSETSMTKIPMQTFSPDIPWPDDEMASSGQQAGISKTQAKHQKKPAAQTLSGAELRAFDYRNNSNPQVGWPRPVWQNSRWISAPPAPPGPYGFVPNYMPRSAVNSNNQFGYNNPYNPVYNNPSHNNYGMQYGRPMPGAVYPPSAVDHSAVNPSMRNPAYFYGYPNQGGLNQGANQNNLNRNNLHQK